MGDNIMVSNLYKKSKKRIWGRILLPLSIKKIKQTDNKKIDELIDFCFNDVYGLIEPMQIKEEIRELLKIIKESKPKNIMEIGTAWGGTLFLLCKVAPKHSKIISVDLPGSILGGGYPNWRKKLYNSFTTKNQQLNLVKLDSHSKQSYRKIQKIIGDEKLDFLYIDGDHTYEGVKRDFNMYSKLVKEGGIITLHDIVNHPNQPNCNVDRFWKEIKEKYKTKEIISSGNQNWAGIGVIYK